jgi:hypothetical protein
MVCRFIPLHFAPRLLPFFFGRHGLIGFFPRWEVGQAATMFLGETWRKCWQN